MNHRWSELDDVIALYVYRFGVNGLGTNLEGLARSRGIKVSSLRMRVKNFQALDGKGGLENWSDQSERVYRKYREITRDVLRALIR